VYFGPEKHLKYLDKFHLQVKRNQDKLDNMDNFIAFLIVINDPYY
jgi:hypothetical protein